MAGKKLPKNVDFAAGFFSQPTEGEYHSGETAAKKITPPAATTEQKHKAKEQTAGRNAGGRPKKEGLKNEQFTLTMNPETYEKLRILADEYTGGNFSRLIEETVKSFCRENKINLADIKLKPEKLEKYKKKQANKANKK